jgi:putative transcriptional regulator
MSKTERKTRPISKALLETARDFRRGGLIDQAAHDKITMRHLGRRELAKVEPVTPEEVKIIRERANMSQAVFAHHLNVTVGYVSQLERGVKRPTGAALALLNIIRRKGSRRFSKGPGRPRPNGMRRSLLRESGDSHQDVNCSNLRSASELASASCAL